MFLNNLARLDSDMVQLAFGGLTINQLIGHIAEKRGIKLEPNDPAFALVELNLLAMQPFFDKLNEFSPGQTNSKELKEFQAHIAQAIAKGNERILQVVGQGDAPSDSQQNSIKQQLETFTTVQQQWTEDMIAIGQDMTKAQERMDELLQHVAMLQTRFSSKQETDLGAGTAPTVQAIQATHNINRDKRTSWLPSVLASTLTAGLLVSGYFVSDIPKNAQLGGSLAREWTKLDLSTRTKLTEALKAK